MKISEEEVPRAQTQGFSLPQSPIPFAKPRPRSFEQKLRSPLLSPGPNPFTDTAASRVYSSTKEPETDLPCILIGIDFGTTHSGVAWAYSKQPDDIKIVTNWDSQEWMNTDKGKAPTEIAYPSRTSNSHTARDSSLDQDCQTAWGYGIGDVEPIKWFKLLLLDDEDMDTAQKDSTQIKRARKLLMRARKSPVQAVADYLRLLWQHAVANIVREFTEIVVESLPFRVVLTVPAVWTTKAKEKMKYAAKRAGILDDRRLADKTTLHFVSEPEAAALATFDDLKTRPNFRVGDTFVVCDAGGGTVDLISYKVLQSQPLQLGECVEGTGDLCGAIFLDQDFEALMEQLIGDAWTNVPVSVIKSLMNVQWENGIKRGFEGQERKWRITLPYECTQLKAPREILLDKYVAHCAPIFDNVTSQIRRLVNDQISMVEKKEGRLPKAVVLVGGLGSCRYLFNALKLENKDRGIEIQQSQGSKPWTAICRGAVLKALTNSLLPGIIITSRISRHSYGIMHNTQFEPQVHLESEKWYDPCDGIYKAIKQMSWYLKRGDDTEETSPVRLEWSRNLRTDQYGPSYLLQEKIYLCKDADPPSRMTQNVTSSCNIGSTLNISQTPQIIGADGNTYKRLDFEIEMRVIGTALEFALIVQGKEMDQSQVEVEFENY
ncbi:hypothetical protein BCR34DRAFT_473300 [Clohesyomyces aquaticus]|uniref:Actin-like ATPase domain-containing protein n=1 Tax=Clohesyomyces aquaticus TaxID=1231657 RepID=A0A1Y2A7Y4_9PLEO|nr:hypothetical protein BCR34DRAFT_473300 [Clohesyomyces aquaticus]